MHTSIVYTQHNGMHYIVDGYHRASVASNLRMGNVPTIQVDLPYKGYTKTRHLEYSNF